MPLGTGLLTGAAAPRHFVRPLVAGPPGRTPQGPEPAAGSRAGPSRRGVGERLPLVRLLRPSPAVVGRGERRAGGTLCAAGVLPLQSITPASSSAVGGPLLAKDGCRGSAFLCKATSSSALCSWGVAVAWLWAGALPCSGAGVGAAIPSAFSPPLLI